MCIVFVCVFQEYVDEYSDWLLNTSIASHFNAFKEGFDLVMGNIFLADMFRPEELEMMVCGSNVSVPSVLTQNEWYMYVHVQCTCRSIIQPSWAPVHVHCVASGFMYMHHLHSSFFFGKRELSRVLLYCVALYCVALLSRYLSCNVLLMVGMGH